MAVSSRQGLIDYCKRELGWPVVEINIDDDQVEDRVDEAIQYYQQFNYDATHRTYLQHQVTSTDITNQYLTISDNIIGVQNIFPLTTGNTTNNMFDIRYQMRLNDIQSLTSAKLSYYYITQTHLQMINMLLAGQIPYEFNRHMDRIYPHLNWETDVVPGDYLLFEVMEVLDPDTYTQVYSDRMLKKYCTALFKRQWAMNIKKFGNIELPGGVVLQGPELYLEATQEIKEIEIEMREMYELPPEMQIG